MQLKLRADYTTIVTRDETTGLGLRNRPGHKESLTAIWTPTAQVTLSASVLYVGQRSNSIATRTVPRVDAHPYALVNLAGSYKVDEHVYRLRARRQPVQPALREPGMASMRPGLGVYGGVRVNELNGPISRASANCSKM